MSRPVKMMNAGTDNYAPSAFQFPFGAPSSTKRKADDQAAPEKSQEKRRKITTESITKRKEGNPATTVEPSSKRQKLAAAAPAPHAKYTWDDFNSPADRPKISPKAPSKHKATLSATSDEVSASRPRIQPKSGNRLKRKATETGNDCVKRWRVDTPLTAESDEEEPTAKASEESSSTDSTEAPRAGDSYPTPEQAGSLSPPSLPTGFDDSILEETDIPQDGLSVASATVSSVSYEASESNLPAPSYNPSACFTVALPAPIAPWSHPFPAPTPRMTQLISTCPIDWTKASGLKPEQIEAFELRAPWNPSPATFSSMAQNTKFLAKGSAPTEEGIRKRFKAACRAVFKTSGVYFDTSGLDLEAYGVPKTAKVKELVKEARTAHVQETAVNAGNSLDEKPDPSDIGQSLDAGVPDTTAAGHETRPRPRGSRQRESAADRLAHSYYSATQWAGSVVAFEIRESSSSPATIRFCDARLVAHRRLFCEVSSVQAFDRWHSTVCFGGTRTRFPMREVICQQVGKQIYMLRDNGKPPAEQTTLALMIETYCLSQAMGTVGASKMIMKEIIQKLGKADEMLSVEDVKLLRGLVHSDALRHTLHERMRAVVMPMEADSEVESGSWAAISSDTESKNIDYDSDEEL
ncbi:hypothetical protein E8E13_002146 [Curvularia kusanoi]|uniref:Uncharacterized protein n=1 Tax=Curvularia kusanoi TaxID=90978 RepID=A0A9P4T485_CURKU|nr:hypothetical protein E8E13_002146 [Curvularia kusanoi]